MKIKSMAASRINLARVDNVLVVGVSACITRQCVMCVTEMEMSPGTPRPPPCTYSIIYSQVLSTRS